MTEAEHRAGPLLGDLRVDLLEDFDRQRLERFVFQVPHRAPLVGRRTTPRTIRRRHTRRPRVGRAPRPRGRARRSTAARARSPDEGQTSFQYKQEATSWLASGFWLRAWLECPSGPRPPSPGRPEARARRRPSRRGGVAIRSPCAAWPPAQRRRCSRFRVPRRDPAARQLGDPGRPHHVDRRPGQVAAFDTTPRGRGRSARAASRISATVLTGRTSRTSASSVLGVTTIARGSSALRSA